MLFIVVSLSIFYTIDGMLLESTRFAPKYLTVNEVESNYINSPLKNQGQFKPVSDVSGSEYQRKKYDGPIGHVEPTVTPFNGGEHTNEPASQLFLSGREVVVNEESDLNDIRIPINLSPIIGNINSADASQFKMFQQSKKPSRSLISDIPSPFRSASFPGSQSEYQGLPQIATHVIGQTYPVSATSMGQMGLTQQIGKSQLIGPSQQLTPSQETGIPQQMGLMQQMGPSQQTGIPQQMGLMQQTGVPQQMGPMQQKGPSQQSGLTKQISPMQQMGGAEQSTFVYPTVSMGARSSSSDISSIISSEFTFSMFLNSIIQLLNHSLSFFGLKLCQNKMSTPFLNK